MKDFKEAISVDLKQVICVKFLHITYDATYFRVVAVVKSKLIEEIVEIFIKYWITIFGAPKRIVSDNRWI